MRNLENRIYLIFFCLCAFGASANSQGNKNEIQDDRTIDLVAYNLKFASPTFELSWEVRRDVPV